MYIFLRLLYKFISFISVLYLNQHAFADEKIRPLSFDSIEDLRLQKHYRLRNAQVAWVNYPRLKTDFPKLRYWGNTEIDHWILNNFAYISNLQLPLCSIRTSECAIDIRKARTFAHPRNYFRAALAPISSARKPSLPNRGIIDIKGSGSSNQIAVEQQITEFQRIERSPYSDDHIRDLNRLRTFGHSDGMMSLGEAIAEVSRQLAIQMSFDQLNHHTGSAYETVESYFIIDPGIEILKNDGATIPAGILGRQAHWRGQSNLSVPSTIYTDHIGGHQGTKFESSVDFGSVIITHPTLQKTFGKANDPTCKSNPQQGRAWQIGHETAAIFRTLAATDYSRGRQAINQHFATMLAPITTALLKIRHENKRLQSMRYLTSRLQARDRSAREIALRLFQLQKSQDTENAFPEKSTQSCNRFLTSK